MLNIISFLLIVLTSMICEKSTGIPNQLLNTGVLLLSAYVFSQASVLMRAVSETDVSPKSIRNR